MKSAFRSLALPLVPLALSFAACNGGGGSTEPTEPDAAGYETTDSSVIGIEPDAGTDSSVPVVACDDHPVGDVERRTRYQSELVEGDAECLAQKQTRVCQDDGSWSVWSGDYVAESCSVEGFADCDGEPHGTRKERTAYETALVPFGAECRAQTQERTCSDGAWSAFSGTFTSLTCEVEGAPSCGDQPHMSSEERLRYRASLVPYGLLCEAEAQTRTCTLGTWSEWTGTFEEENCRILEALSCGDFAHATVQVRTLFATALVKPGETCQAETQARRCDNGAWTPWTGTFQESKCEVEGERSCGDVPHGEEARRVRYREAQVPYGAQCTAEHQTAKCNDGQLGEFSGDLTVEECSVTPPADCEGGKHGDERTQQRFEAAEVPYGQDCKSELQVSTCENGTWSPFFGSFAVEACVVHPPADCAGGKHGDQRTQQRFEAAEVPYGQDCKPERQVSTCVNGLWSAFSGSFAAEQCEVQPPADCEGGKHGAERARERYPVASVAFGQPCTPETQVSKCENGSWSQYTGSYTFAACTVLPPPSCGGVAHGASETRTAYASTSVPAGQACKSEQQSRTCNAGSFSPWTGSYSALSCRVLGRSCTDYVTNKVVADGDSQSRVQYEAAFPASQCKPETQTRTCTDGTFGAWSGTYQSLGCSPLSTRTLSGASCRLYQVYPSVGGMLSCSQFEGVNPADVMCSSAEKDATHGCPTGGTAYAKCATTVQDATSTAFYYTPQSDIIKNACTQNGGIWTLL